MSPRVPDVTDAEYSADVTQVVSVAQGQVLGMVEIKAEREGRTLHNHAAFLAAGGGRADHPSSGWSRPSPRTATSSGRRTSGIENGQSAFSPHFPRSDKPTLRPADEFPPSGRSEQQEHEEDTWREG